MDWLRDLCSICMFCPLGVYIEVLFDILFVLFALWFSIGKKS